MRNRFWALALGVLGVAGVTACSEKLDSGAACPALCPVQNSVEVRDTLLDGVVVLDTSLTGYPAQGEEAFLLLASRGDTLETRAVVRFDSLLARFTVGTVDSAITRLDSTMLTLRIDADFSKQATGATIEAYDVDTPQDTVQSAILALFRADRLLGSVTLSDSVVPDSVKMPLSDSAVLAKITGKERLRIGLRVRGGTIPQLRLLGRESGAPARLSYRPTADTAVRTLTVAANSKTPANDLLLATDLIDYTIVVRAMPVPPPTTLVVGGIPSRRSYLRFDVPARLVDSVTVLRATLLLTQAPNRLLSPTDTFVVYPQFVTAGLAVTDLNRAINILAPPGSGVDSIRVAPGDSGLRSIDMVGVVRSWKNQGTTPSQRALVFRAGQEGSIPFQALFYSSEAPASVRPRMRIIYVSRVDFGVP